MIKVFFILEEFAQQLWLEFRSCVDLLEQGAETVLNTCPSLSQRTDTTAPIITAINTWGDPTGFHNFPNISGSINSCADSSAGARFKDRSNRFSYQVGLILVFLNTNELDGSDRTLLSLQCVDYAFGFPSPLKWQNGLKSFFLKEGVIQCLLLIAVSQRAALDGLWHKAHVLLLFTQRLKAAWTMSSCRHSPALTSINRFVFGNELR